jgi:hypothetical protein
MPFTATQYTPGPDVRTKTQTTGYQDCPLCIRAFMSGTPQLNMRAVVHHQAVLLFCVHEKRLLKIVYASASVVSSNER